MASYKLERSARMLEMQGVPLVSFWRRAAAFLLDIVFMSILFAAVAGTMALLLHALGWLRPAAGFSFRLSFSAHGFAWVNWYSIAWVIVYFGLFTFFGRGRTPGKWLMGIRVVSLVHERIPLWQSVERALGYGASMLEFGFGFLQYYIHPNRRTVHDLIAETIVVREPWKRNGKKAAKKQRLPLRG